MINTIDRISVRTILNSQGGRSIEANLFMQDGTIGYGAAARAIVPGRRERDLTSLGRLGLFEGNPKLSELESYLKGHIFESQREFDALFFEGGAFEDVGSDIALALSLAFCRAQAHVQGHSLAEQMISLSNLRPSIPHPLVNIFSGGVHGGHISFQQLMVIPQYDNIQDDIEAALMVYNEIEKTAKDKSIFRGYSASSGMLTSSHDVRELFEIISTVLERLGVADKVALGTDVAAEHMEQGDGTYLLGAQVLNGDELANFHRNLLKDFNFCFYEDPFGPDDFDLWKSLTEYASPSTMVVGDDLFATNSKNIDPRLASGILLKMNQVGTVSGTLDAAIAAKEAGMQLCVSHRSKETEDTSICDLSVAVGAELIKIGGPRRGDRIAKYNQLIRLAEVDKCGWNA